jgi:aminoglycoside phosphotransferase (APT) family kinase protein
VSEALTVKRADGLFAELLPGRGRVRAVARFAEGSVTGAYRVEFARAESAPAVLKLYARGDRWSAAKEAAALRFLTAHGIDVSPRLLAFSGSVPGLGDRSCVVSELRPGRTLTMLDDELTREQRHDVYRQLGHVLGRLHAIPADGYGAVRPGGSVVEIRDPLPDNSAHMARVFELELGKYIRGGDRTLADKIATHVAAHAPVFAECRRASFCHGDVHEPNLLAELDDGDDGDGEHDGDAVSGNCSLTGLLDPLNMHAGDPLLDFVRLDAFSLRGDPTKIAGLLSGYGVSTAGSRPGAWPEAWRPRMRLYRIALALELFNWFTFSGQTSRLPALDRELRGLVGEEAHVFH